MAAVENKQTFKEFLFGKDGYYNNLHIPFDPSINALMAAQKATTPLTYSDSTTWFDPQYLGNLMLDGLTRSTKAFRVLRKTNYQTEGDSYQTITTDSHEGLGNILESGSLFSAYTNPAIVDTDMIYPAVLKYSWVNTEVAAAMSQIQGQRRTPTLEQIRQYVSAKFLDAIDQQLCGVYASATVHGVDTPATDSGIAQFECFDRIVTNVSECTTDHVSAVTDGDIFWNSTGDTTPKFDRNNGEGGGDAQAQVVLPSVAGTEEHYNICDELDDLAADCMRYLNSEDGDPDYVVFMSPKAYNKVKAENDPKALITNWSGARQTVNGVTSTPGAVGGKMPLSALQLSDVVMPIVTLPYLNGTEASNNLWKNSKYTTGGVGNIYLWNQRAAEFRTLIPITYRSVPAEDSLQTKHTLYMAGQLIAKNWKSFGALKYIAS